MTLTTLKKPVMLIPLIFVSSFVGCLPVFGQGVEITNIQTSPSSIHVGDSFHFNATIVNNSPDTISYNGGCMSPLYATFDKNVVTGQAMSCLAIFIANIKPGENATVVGPSSGSLYTANSSGTTNANVTFSYQIGNNSENTISKLFTFDISEKTSVPEFSFISVMIFTVATMSLMVIMASLKNHNLFKL